MQSVIIIVPSDLETEADQLAQALGLPGGQLTQPYGETHLMCHFPSTPGFAAALAGPLPGWVQHVDCDAADQMPADPSKVCIFTSAALDGWVHLAAVDSWPRA